MKRFANNMIAALVLCAMTSVVASAKMTTERVTFPQDVMVNGTMVKKGTYKVTFDDVTGVLNIHVSKKSIATTTARWEKRDRKALETRVSSIMQGDTRELRSITMSGDNQSIVVGASEAATATAEQ
ncbi:MAG: hypothetical protein H0V88_04705 [Pyrinomonadaceae bacterium]|nr:hypothetical protein [Pyrinomonadaceae bacterium]